MGTLRSVRFPALVLSLSVLLANCGERITEPGDATIAASGFLPASAMEAAHNPSAPRVYFLPPLVPATAFEGVFDATLLDHLSVEICRASGATCVGAPLVTFGAGDGSSSIRLDTDEQHYIVNWSVKGPDIVPGDYRLNLRLGSVVIGGVALRLASKPQDLKNVAPDVVGMQIGRTVPVKFRIEQSGDAAVSLTLTPLAATILLGGSWQFTATVLNSDGTPRPGETITWSSSDNAIATVNGSGLATGLASGSATITATAAGLTASSALHVQAPDLKVQQLTAPASVTLGGSIALEATVANSGDANAGAATIRFRVLNATTSEEVSAVTLDQPAIAAGASATVSASITPEAGWPRSLAIEVITDAAATVTESDETNNSARSADIGFTAPDLTVAVSTSASSVVAGSTFDVAAVVTNNGTSGAAASKLRVRVLNAETNEELVATTRDQLAVAAGEATTMHVTLTSAHEWPASVIVEVTTDADATVAEWDESNNSARSAAIAITRPDLTVAALTVPAQVAGGAALDVTVSVKNLGNGAAGATNLRVRVLKSGTTEEVATSTVAQAAVAAGASLDVSVSFATTTAWPRDVVVEATTDLGAAVTESDETNNSATSTEIAITLPDLRVAEVIAPAGLPAGGSLEVRATIGNIGTAPAAAAQARFRVLDASNNSEVATVTQAQDAVVAGATTTVVANLTTSRDWPRSVVVEVTTDPGNTVVESDEANNTARSAVIGLTDPDFVITSVTFSTTSVGLRCALGLQAVVRNSGTGAAPAASLRFSLRNTDGVAFASVVVAQPALAAGAEATVNASFVAGSNWPGEVAGLAEADAANAVPEISEANNSGTASVLVKTRVVVPAGFHKLWICGDNTSWTNANNWEPAGVPVAGQNVYIPAGVTLYPVLGGAQSVNDITIEDGARVDVNSNALTATGNVVSGLMTGTTGHLNLTGITKTLRGAVPIVDVHGSVALSGDVSATSMIVNPGRSVSIGAFSLQTSSDVIVHATNAVVNHLAMLDPAGRLVVGRDLTVGGPTRLDAGTIHVRRNLTQNGAVNALTPGGTKFIFDGTGAQNIHFTHLRTSFLRDVEIRGPSVNASSNWSVFGQLDVAAGGGITQSSGGTYYATRVPDEASAGGYRVPTSVIDGNVEMVRDVSLAASNASIVVDPGHQLNMTDFELIVGGNFTVQATNAPSDHVLMATGSPQLEVRGNMTIGARTRLDAGSIVLRGNFTQNGAVNAMIPNGTKMVLDGPAQHNVHFTHLGTSWLDDVEVRTTIEAGGVNFSSNLTIRGQLTAISGSLVTQSSGGAYYVNRVPEELSPAAYRVPTSVIAGPAMLVRDVTLGSSLANIVVDPGHSLSIGEHSLDMAGSFTIQATNAPVNHLIMLEPAGRLLVGRDFTSGALTRLDAGAIHVRRNLTQNGAVNALTPAGTKFIFDGTGAQNIHFTHLRTSFLRDVEIRGPSVNASSNWSVFGQLDVAAGGGITQSVGGTYYTTRVPDEVAAGGYRVPTSVIDGNAVMVRNVKLASPLASIVVDPGHQLNLAGFQLSVGGNFTVQATNAGVDHVLMAIGNPRLEVGGSMVVGARTKLDVGSIAVRGNFTQNGAVNAMIPTGTTVIFDGTAAQGIHFTHLGTSWLGDVDVRGPAVNITSNMTVRGQLTMFAGARLTQTSGGTYYTTRVPDPGPGSFEVPTSVVDGNVVMTHDVVWPFAGANLVVDPGHSLDIRSHTLDIAGSFTIAATNVAANHLMMLDPAGRLLVGRDFTAGAFTRLDAGAIHVRRNLTQNGAVNALTPAGTKFILDGAGAQNIHFTHLGTSWLRDVEIRGPSVSASSNWSVFGQLDVAAGGGITQSVGGTYYRTRVPTEVTAGGYRVPTSVIDGNVVMVRNVTLAAPNASIFVDPGHQLDMAGYQLTVGGNFTVHGTNVGVDHVLMTSGSPILEVRGQMTVGARTKLDVGSIVLRGNFTQNGAVNSMIPTGTQMVFDGSVPQNIHFTHYGTSWLGGTRIAPGASVTTSSNVWAKGSLDLDGSLFHQGGVYTLQGTLFFGGALRNNGSFTVTACVNEGGTFTGTGNNPCP